MPIRKGVDADGGVDGGDLPTDTGVRREAEAMRERDQGLGVREAVDVVLAADPSVLDLEEPARDPIDLPIERGSRQRPSRVKQLRNGIQRNVNDKSVGVGSPARAKYRQSRRQILPRMARRNARAIAVRVMAQERSALHNLG